MMFMNECAVEKNMCGEIEPSVSRNMWDHSYGSVAFSVILLDSFSIEVLFAAFRNRVSHSVYVSC